MGTDSGKMLKIQENTATVAQTTCSSLQTAVEVTALSIEVGNTNYKDSVTATKSLSPYAITLQAHQNGIPSNTDSLVRSARTGQVVLSIVT